MWFKSFYSSGTFILFPHTDFYEMLLSEALKSNVLGGGKEETVIIVNLVWIQSQIIPNRLA